MGWREWVALPGLGLPAVKAKIDTGARTSALHAFEMHLEGDRVRFAVHPVQRNERLSVWAEAEVADYRTVVSSNGQSEHRAVIRTPLRLGDASWDIELTLTDRRRMQFRMLLGRTALAGRLLVDPNAAYLHGQPRHPARLYDAR